MQSRMHKLLHHLDEGYIYCINSGTICHNRELFRTHEHKTNRKTMHTLNTESRVQAVQHKVQPSNQLERISSTDTTENHNSSKQVKQIHITESFLRVRQGRRRCRRNARRSCGREGPKAAHAQANNHNRGNREPSEKVSRRRP